MEKQLIQYANGCSLAVNAEKTEAILSFFQSQPAFNPESAQLDLAGVVEVNSVILPFTLLEQLENLIEQCKQGGLTDKE